MYMACSARHQKYGRLMGAISSACPQQWMRVLLSTLQRFVILIKHHIAELSVLGCVGAYTPHHFVVWSEFHVTRVVRRTTPTKCTCFPMQKHAACIGVCRGFPFSHTRGTSSICARNMHIKHAHYCLVLLRMPDVACHAHL